MFKIAIKFPLLLVLLIGIWVPATAWGEGAGMCREPECGSNVDRDAPTKAPPDCDAAKKEFAKRLNNLCSQYYKAGSDKDKIREGIYKESKKWASISECSGGQGIGCGDFGYGSGAPSERPPGPSSSPGSSPSTGGGSGGSGGGGSGGGPRVETKPTPGGEREKPGYRIDVYPTSEYPGSSSGKTQPELEKLIKVLEQLDTLQATLRDDSPVLRRAAAQTLGTIGRDAGPAVSALVDTLRDEDPSVRQAAVLALQEIGPKGLDGVPPLLARLRDEQEDPAMRKLAKEILTRTAERIGTSVQPSVIEGVPKPNQWMVVPSGADPTATLLERTDGSLDPAPVPPGQYDIYWAQDYEHRSKPLLLAKDVTVGEQGVTSVTLNSGVRLEQAAWVPKRNKDYGWWGVTRAGEAPNKRLHWTKGAEALLLPPGAYDVYWAQDYETHDKPLQLASGVKVEPGQVASLSANSGVRLEVASWVPKRHKDYGWWGVTRAGEAPNKRLHWTKGAEALLLPPDIYDVYWVQDYETQGKPLLLASGVKVELSQVASVSANSGVRLEAASWVPKRDTNYGWWGATRAGEAPDKRVHWSKGAEALLLPPDIYDVYWVQDYETQGKPLLLASGVQVEPGRVASVSATSGVRLEAASWVPKRDQNHGWWGATRAGDPPDKRLHWSKAAEALLLPPGTYDVYWVQDYEAQGKPLLLASRVKVEPSQVASVSANSGIKLKLPVNTPALDANNGWWGVVPAGKGPDDRIHWSKGRSDQPLLIPPGTYDIFWKQNYSHTPERIKQAVTVQDNKLVDVEVRR